MSIAVIGAGIAGFSAAIEATRTGRKVVLYDGRDQPGGRARTRTVDGFRLNEGAHALYVGGPANTFLRELGCEPDGGVPALGNGLAISDDVSGVFPIGLWSLLRTPVLKGDRVRLAKLFAGLGRLDPSDFASMTVAETMAQLLGHGRGARLGLALFRLSTYGNDAEHASGDPGIVQLKLAGDGGVRYLDGGWQTIVDTLAAEAVGRGVEIRPGAKVASVRADEGRFRLAGPDLDSAADSVVLAVGGSRNVSRILGDACTDAVRWADAARPAAVASLDVGLDVEWGDAATFALGMDDPLYLSVHAPVARLAPEGHTLVHVMRYRRPDEPDDATRDRAQCEQLLDRVRPGWRDHVAHLGFNRRLVAATDQPRAAAGGLTGRPGIAVPGMDGLFVAGDWVGSTGLLADASVASGRAAGAAAAVVPAVATR
jgi:phytoene dehydrogenase-like protein